MKSRHSTDLTTPPASYDHVVMDDDGAALLWDCGVHPEHVLRLHDALKLDATPLPGRFYPHVVAFRPDLGWLRHSLDNRRSTSMAAWLAATETGRDRAEPSLRHDWLAAGVPQRTIVPLTEAGFSPDDVRRLARHTGRPMDSAAIVFHRWVEALCPLDVDDLVRLHDLGVQLTFKPSSGALHTLAFDHKQELEGVSRRELGLLYAVAGTTRTTRVLISSGIRTPEEAVRYLQSPG